MKNQEIELEFEKFVKMADNFGWWYKKDPRSAEIYYTELAFQVIQFCHENCPARLQEIVATLEKTFKAKAIPSGRRCLWCEGTGYIPQTGIMCRTCHGVGHKPNLSIPPEL